MNYRLRILARGWNLFTGNFGGADFVDGLSVDPLPRLLADRIAGMIQCEIVEEDGSSGGQAGVATRYHAMKNFSIEPVDRLDRMTQAELLQERRDAIARALTNPAQRIYNQQELVSIATKDGIKGIRAIGDLWGVRDRAINKLIFEILKAQSEYLSQVDKREAAAKLKREEAAADALRIQKEQEAEIDRQARVLGAPAVAAPATVDTTPNSIGADGLPVHSNPNIEPEINPLLQPGGPAITTDPETGVTSIDYTKIDGAV